MVVDEGEGVSLYMLEGYLAQGWPLIILVCTKLYSDIFFMIQLPINFSEIMS